MYRILTEDKNRELVQELASARFQGFTLYPVTGFWNGKQERSLAIEVSSPGNSSHNEQFKNKVKTLAMEIKAVNKQDAVLIQTIPDTGELI